MTSEESQDFASLGAHPALAQTLAQRGYDTPTGVQAAVLEAEDRDLLVSSQTGSGKTVAFGLLIGRALLGEEARLPHAPRPRALVIAPTRELAVQVQRELHWLFAGTGARIASFTGGTDLRLDARALKHGVELVVGTPGRLVDLTERKALDLSAIELVVLDEADEMLDLGFRDALEALLQLAPKERRTLLFSATLPPAIRELAKRYQRDPLPVDPRRGAPQPHEDIRHVAHLCANGERLAALVNVLRLADDERAIVFCRTRENVAELHRQLSMRGFLATAISGDREQAERTRALEALRQGRVRVLVATNVAARGLDLPDVGLVVHADLAENAEALTHRSGRTGRAGKKGVSVYIVEVGQRRRAERLFRDAHLKLRWTEPPSAQAVAAHDRERLYREVGEAMATPPSDTGTALAARLLGDHDAVALVATLLDRAIAERPAGEKLTPPSLPSEPAHAPPRRELPRRQGADRGANQMALFQINLGAKDRAEANWILPLLCRRGAITRREVGAIRVERERTFFEINAAVANDFAANAAETDPRAPHVRIGRAEGASLPARSIGPLGHARPHPHPHKAPPHPGKKHPRRR
jgi:ATP-dependent RNA helicase DeaD